MDVTGVPRHNLPVQLTSLVGREQELAEVAVLLADTHLLTLTGVGGVGKTRLALAAANRLAAGYPDGVWLVELAPLADAALVPHAVATGATVPLAPGEDPLAALLRYFRPRRALLVLDNCEHLVAACAH